MTTKLAQHVTEPPLLPILPEHARAFQNADYDLFCTGMRGERGPSVSVGEQGIAPTIEHALVTALEVDTGKHRAVRHASEAYSPGDEGFEGSDYVAFTPDGKISLCTPEEVRSLIKEYQSQGFTFGVKDSWGINPPSERDENLRIANLASETTVYRNPIEINPSPSPSVSPVNRKALTSQEERGG